MKQKRKIKSLLPQKQKEQTYLITTILLILSLVLCIWTAALITSSVWATDSQTLSEWEGDSSEARKLEPLIWERDEDWGNSQTTEWNTQLETNYQVFNNWNTQPETNYKVFDNFEYEKWIDDNKEVLYGIKFVDPQNFKKEISKIYIDESSLYISPNPVVVNNDTSNNVVVHEYVWAFVDRWSEGVSVIKRLNYSHILWWKGNEIWSNNITIIAWSGNKVKWGNDNASVLWWIDNGFGWDINQKNSVYIWWENNELKWTNVPNERIDPHQYAQGPSFIWWKNNYGEIGSDETFMIWWEWNKIENSWIWRIVWWQNVIVSGVNNIFVYSNTWNFTPQSSNAFYLNMDKWVWVNTTGTIWLSVEGAVKIDMDLDSEYTGCSTNNTWTIATYKWCIVWCTSTSISEGKWELIDGWEDCKEKLKAYSARILIDSENINPQTEAKNVIDAQCTDNVDTWNATLCSFDSKLTGAYIWLFKNVFFETTLIDSDSPCPIWQENQCVFKCNSGYHLTWTEAGVRCYKDCELPWTDANGNKIEIKHNETVIWYNTENVSCSNGIYVFPLNTEIINKWQPLMSPLYAMWNTTINGVSYNNRAQGGKSPETCGNYDHKKTLICNDWKLYLMNSDRKADLNTEVVAKNYKYASCNLYSYSCDASYNLTQTTIATEKKDQPKNDNRINTDRGTQNWERAQYKLCIDYGVNPNPTMNWESCSKWEYRYVLTRCQNGYHTWQWYENVCMKDCTLKKLNGSDQSYRHNAVVTWYVDSWATCTGTCQAATLRCDDGKWMNSSNHEETGYPYNDCTLNNYVCSWEYNVSETIYNQWSGTSSYESCDSYNANGKFQCVKSNTRYKLVWCKEWYHAELNRKYCIRNRDAWECDPKPDNSHWVWLDGKVTNYPWKKIFGDIDLKAVLLSQNKSYSWWLYLKWWTWAWDATNGRDTTNKYPSNACDWECNSWFHKNSTETECVKNSCGSIPSWPGVITWSNWPSNNDMWWTYDADAYKKNSLWTCQRWCKDGYHRDGNEKKCVTNECHHCAKSGFPYCFPIDFSDDCKENNHLQLSTWWQLIFNRCHEYENLSRICFETNEECKDYVGVHSHREVCYQIAESEIELPCFCTAKNN